MAQRVKISVREAKLRLVKAQAKDDGVSLSSLLARGLQHDLEARARLEADLELYGQDGWPTAEERRASIDSWTVRTPKAMREGTPSISESLTCELERRRPHLRVARLALVALAACGQTAVRTRGEERAGGDAEGDERR